MTTELYWMTLTVFMTALFWVPYVLDRYIVRGFWPALAAPSRKVTDRNQCGRSVR